MKGFISYSHEDHGMFAEFGKHLKSIERAFEIEIWADKRITAGERWSSEIEKAIASADLFILLTSPAFIASDYIYHQEIPAIKARHKSVGALVLPVVLRRCAWQMVADVLQALPSVEGRVRPVADWRRLNDGFDEARSQVAIAIQSYFGLTVQSVDWSS